MLRWTKKALALMLAIVLIVGTTLSVSASRGDIVGGWDEYAEESIMPVSEEDDSTSINKIGDDIFYTEILDGKIVNAILYANGLVEISIGYENDSNVKTLLEQTGKSRNAMAEEDTKGFVNSMIDNYDFEIIDMSSRLNGETDRDVQASVYDRLLSKCYQAGEPAPYYNYLRQTKYYRGVYGYLYHTNSYSISQQSWVTVFAGDMLSTIASALFTGVGSIRDVIMFFIDSYGNYRASRNGSVGKYDVYQHGNKDVKVGNMYPYRAGRTRAWEGIVGDYGEVLNDRYTSYDYDYFDNNALLTTGIDYYFAFGW